MTQEHSFPQLISILDAVHSANPRDEAVDTDTSDDESFVNDDGDRLLGLPGVRGEAKLTMLTDVILERLEVQKGSLAPETREVNDGDFPEEHSLKEEDMDSHVEEHPFGSIAPEKVHRQTLIFSATLTLPFTSTKTTGTTKIGKRSRKLGLAGGIAEILEKTRAMGQTKIVDLTTSFPKASPAKNSIPAGGVRLPPGLSLELIKCTQKHKDSHLYAYLMTTAQGASGPCLIFCNSIAAVRRVGATLQLLGFPVRILHAHMQQVRCHASANSNRKGFDERYISIQPEFSSHLLGSKRHAVIWRCVGFRVNNLRAFLVSIFTTVNVVYPLIILLTIVVSLWTNRRPVSKLLSP
jgi:ATP-dependent RNA helicase DDX24/MAK5